MAMNDKKVDIEEWQVRPGGLAIGTSEESFEEADAAYTLLKFKKTATQNQNNVFDIKRLPFKKRFSLSNSSATNTIEKHTTHKITDSLVLSFAKSLIKEILSKKNNTKNKSYPIKTVIKSTGFKKKITHRAKTIKTATNVIKKTKLFKTSNRITRSQKRSDSGEEVRF